MKIQSEVRTYLAEAIATGRDIVYADVADQFVTAHEDELMEHAADMVRAAVAAVLKNLCAERAEDNGQLSLLPGIPAAIAIAPGVVRPRERCNWADLQVGRVERVSNIAHAEKALDLYDKDLDRLRPHMES
ncbi:MAG: hypothetical protein H0V07_00895, partial [Propionibacteriales bacterium]|nr:hypothetical protein [Propionibacteriales bacterium]